MEGFEFVSKLSLQQDNTYGSRGNLREIRRQLIEDYCFPLFEIGITHFDIILIFPEGYSVIKKDYLLEIFKYYTAAGVDIKVGTKVEGRVYLEGAVHSIEIKGILS